ncbi:MAG: aspartate-semialdehyde dehydrogenase [Saprospiraceae bacterium]|nr:aspartate-semialdehyde dehydrogenase [Saprospiraceae bacterium]MBK9722282.1 aspartate-semialdehyde dehydrogenase [Saprospiraceae bacterium]
MKLAIVGVTGLVGQVVLKVLEEFNLPIEKIYFVASERSVGKKIHWAETEYEVIGMEEAILSKPDIAIFSAGGNTSLEWAPKFAAEGCYVIDNSSAWRMDPDCPLVVPEINADTIQENTKIIANPNCSTIQMVMALNPLQLKYGIDRLVISTYQSFTGTGMKAVKQYESELHGLPVEEPRAYHHPIFENCIPHCDVFLENGYTKEEMKMVHETHKIWRDPGIKITATAVRVPVHGGHSESINVALKNSFDVAELRLLLAQTKGIKVLDKPLEFEYPTPQQAKNQDAVLVGRIRRDESQANTLNLWVSADNLRKGAATNAVQIAAYLITEGFVK